MDNIGSAPQGRELSELERDVMLAFNTNLQQPSTYRYDQLGRELGHPGEALDRAMQNLRELGLITYDTPLQPDSQMRITDAGNTLIDALEGRGGDTGKGRNAV